MAGSGHWGHRRGHLHSPCGVRGPLGALEAQGSGTLSSDLSSDVLEGHFCCLPVVKGVLRPATPRDTGLRDTAVRSPAEWVERHGKPSWWGNGAKPLQNKRGSQGTERKCAAAETRDVGAEGRQGGRRSPCWALAAGRGPCKGPEGLLQIPRHVTHRCGGETV